MILVEDDAAEVFEQDFWSPMDYGNNIMGGGK